MMEKTKAQKEAYERWEEVDRKMRALEAQGKARTPEYYILGKRYRVLEQKMIVEDEKAALARVMAELTERKRLLSLGQKELERRQKELQDGKEHFGMSKSKSKGGKI